MRPPCLIATTPHDRPSAPLKDTLAVDRYCLTWTIGDRTIMRGWWNDLAVAERKCTSWIGERGSVDGARIALTDEENGRVLKSWPDAPT